MTQGVSVEQARAFRSKLWQLHVASQTAMRSRDAAKASHVDGIAMDKPSSSRERDHETSLRPFKERIRPGMVVSWTPRPGLPLAGETNKALILCPTEAVGGTVKDFLGDVVNVKAEPGKAKQYLCSMIVPGPMNETFVVNLWQQVVVDTDMMDSEVCMEYDAATRYYYIVL